MSVPECAALRDSVHGRAKTVCVVGPDGVPPPGLDGVNTDGTVSRILEAEEDEDDRHGESRVQSRGEDVCRIYALIKTRGKRNWDIRTVVLRPPREMTPADDVLEDESNHRPGHVVDSGCGRDVARSGEDDGEAEVKIIRENALKR